MTRAHLALAQTLALTLALAAALCGCVATQKIPVSTDPSGAVVFLDGRQVCAATPCAVDVPKDQDHLLTVIKPGYRQKDIAVRRVYDTAGVLRDSAVKAVKVGGAGAGGVLSGTVENIEKKESDGSAYIMEPRLVTLRLRGENEPETRSDDPFAEDAAADKAPKRRADGSLDPVELGVEIFKMIGKGQNAAPEK